MILSISPTQTTLYSQLQYSGTPSSFAWVLPIHGTVQVGLSADVLFDSIDAVTATTIQQPNANCPIPADGCSAHFSADGGGSGFEYDAGAVGSVTVKKQDTVGPYATVQLHATDSSALSTWLTQNGFALPAAALPIVNDYIAGGFDFLAMKLLPGQGVQAMRPVRVTAPGASLMLPLRMAGVGTTATVGITVWVVSDGRYEPQNFPFFHIDDSALVWDFSANSSNYAALRSQSESNLAGRGWEIESSIDVSQALLTNTVLSGGEYSPYGGYPTADAGADYLPTAPPDAGAGVDGGPGETADQVRTDDLTTLLAGLAGPNARVTRIRGDIAQSAMTADFVLQASSDQSELANVRTVSSQVNQSCPAYVCDGGAPSSSGDDDAGPGSGSPGAGGPDAGSPGAGDGPTGATASGTTATSGGGCVTAPASDSRGGGIFGFVVGALGLVAARIARGRRTRAKSPD